MELLKSNIISIFMVICTFMLVKFFIFDLRNTKFSKEYVFLVIKKIIFIFLISILAGIFTIGLSYIFKESARNGNAIVVTILLLYAIDKIMEIVYRKKFESEVIRKSKYGYSKSGLGVRVCETKEKLE